MAKLDKIYQERIIAIILGVSCVEAFLNTVGFKKFPDIWEALEQLTPLEKCQIALRLAGRGEIFDAGKEPFQTIKRLSTSRNQLVHFKRTYKETKKYNKCAVSYFEYLLDRDFIYKLPERIQQFVTILSDSTGYEMPNWISADY